MGSMSAMPAEPTPLLPDGDYVSPGLDIIMPDAAFPNMIVGDVSVPRWPYLRRWVEQNWYTDRRHPDTGFVNRDEASILYNSALLFRGKPCLEIGCWCGWSSVHLVLGCGELDIIDPLFSQQEFTDRVTASCAAAGVLDRVRFHAGYSPGAIDDLTRSSGKRWSLVFIDGDHEGDAPRLDAEAAIRNAADTAVVLFHDLASPHVAAGLNAMRTAGWQTMVYQTAQIMGAAWRGDVEPVAHVPDPNVFWTLPKHLSGYPVSGWKHPARPAVGAGVGRLTMEDRRSAAMMRAQEAEDDRDAAVMRAQTAEDDRNAAVMRAQTAQAERDAAMTRAEEADAAHMAALDRQKATQALLNAIDARVEALNIRLSDLTIATSRKEAAQAAQALDARRHRAQTQLIEWTVRKHNLLSLLLRSRKTRRSRIRVQAEILGLVGLTDKSFVAWLCRRRTLLKLLRRSAADGRAAVRRRIDSPNNREATNSLPAGAGGRHRSPRIAGELVGKSGRLPAQYLKSLPVEERAVAPAAGPDNFDRWLKSYYQGLELHSQFAEFWADFLASSRSGQAQDGVVEIIAASLQGNARLATLAEQVRSSPLFDSASYRVHAGLDCIDLYAAAHYLLVGEPLGFSPSAKFDVQYYRERYPDVLEAAMNCFLHYITHGHDEGRRALPATVPFHAKPELMNTHRENIIVAVHETSRTGAPILGWNIAFRLSSKYNIFIIRLGEGTLTPEFEAIGVEVHGPFGAGHRAPIDLERGLASLFADRVFKYAVINSVESRPLIAVCAKHAVPTVVLVHEFISYVRPIHALWKALQQATEIVVPASIVARSMVETLPGMARRRLHVEPQGMSTIPSGVTAKEPSTSEQMTILAEMRAQGALIVIGAGSVTLRKGVDLFIAVAAGVQRLGLKRPVHFVWVGGGYRPEEDMSYSIFLKEQLERSPARECLTLMEEVADLEPLYAEAQALLLTSRLDPLPNVTIDAAHRGIPIICFSDASGMSELLLTNDDAAIGVLPHLDVNAAVQLVASMAADESLRMQMARGALALARDIFDMDRYVRRLDALGTEAAARVERQRADTSRQRAQPSVWFDPVWYAAQHGGPAAHAYEHFLDRGADEGCFPSALVAHVMRSFAPGTTFSLSVYDSLREASANWPCAIPEGALWLLTSLYVPDWHEEASAPLDGFIAYLRDNIATDKSPGPLFSAEVYRNRAAVAADLPPLGLDDSAMLHWLQHGEVARIVPTDRFDEQYYRRSNPDVDQSPQWGFAHFIRFGAFEGRLPAPLYAFIPSEHGETLHANALPNIYKYWLRLDLPTNNLASGRDGLAQYEKRLDALQRSDEFAQTLAEAQAIDPAVGDTTTLTEALLPPLHDILTKSHAEVRRRLPSTHYDTILCVPWIRTGGADLIAGVLAKALLRVRPDERVLILRTDNPHFERGEWLPPAADCVDISDLTRGLPPSRAEHLLRVIFRGLTPRRVINVNSRLCWATCRSYGANLAATFHTYAYMFCWDQTPSGRRVGYPAEYFADTADCMTAFLTDTRFLREELTIMYQLPAAVRDRIVPMLTPARTLVRTPSIARQVFETSASGSRRLVLWAGRLDRQKRFDLVRDIARRMPTVEFRCWGEAVLDTPSEASGLPANIVMQGAFASFDDLPLADAGAWLFTSFWEGMPTTIIELATRGVAVVASDVGGIHELIRPDTGWPIPPGADAADYVEALEAVLSSPEEAMRRAEKLQGMAANAYTEAAYDAALNALLAQEDS